MHQNQDAFFNAFAEQAVWNNGTDNVAIKIIADFDIDTESEYGQTVATGYSAFFELKKDIFEQVQLEQTITYENKVFTIVLIEPFTNQNGYKVAVQL